ncbi:hypothetical protein GCM10010156_34770 [Planobispora rosea]|uniref:DUF4190 domain-containing protein n=1 Tax=Planobispora rosea TaxID=35762 RepID=A0A8J3S3L4_PLARO|nr:hypothetical protein [Planobispora rosea]GGS72901.1 hypothetical protein GCM10010156_34770 [Planobispora rosea]GIH85341.1 hypothetical protein Pro02_37490 [Planobispora rosea]
MSSGTPEGPSTNPGDWKSPYSTGPGQTSGYGGQQPSGYGQPGHGQPATGYDRPSTGYGESPAGYGQAEYGRPSPAAYGGYGPSHDAYGQAGYGQGGYGRGYGYGSPDYHNVDGVRTHGIVALIVSLVLALSCFLSLGGVAGAILSGVALSKVDHETARARDLLKWTWISIGANVVLLVLGAAVFIAAGVNDAFR